VDYFTRLSQEPLCPAHPRPREIDATDAMTQKLFFQIVRVANPKSNPESIKQTKPTATYDHRKYGPSELFTRTQFQEEGKAKDQRRKIEEHAASGNHNRRPLEHSVTLQLSSTPCARLEEIHLDDLGVNQAPRLSVGKKLAACGVARIVYTRTSSENCKWK